MTRKILVEGIGTFFLMLTIGQVVLEPGAGGLAPLAVGAVLMTMVYAGGHVSGGHYNPALTLAAFIRGRASVHDLIGYVVFQCAFAALAAMVVLFIKGDGPLTIPELDVPVVLVGETAYTFALAFVFLNVATARGVEGNSYYGLAIGFTVVAGAYAVGPVTGGAFNPAVTVGSLVLGGIGIADVWVYWVAQLVGGAAAGIVFNVLDLGDDKATTATPDEQAALTPPGEPE